MNSLEHYAQGAVKRVRSFIEAPSDQTDMRRTICMQCAMNSKPGTIDGKCQACGCPIAAKTRLHDERCPNQLW